MKRNHSYTDKIYWTPKLSYAVGLIVTDGSLSKDGRHIILRSSDLQLLETFKDCLGLSNKISQTKNDKWAKKPCYRIQFSNVRLYRWLNQIGVTPRKTYKLGSLKIPDKYFPDFLRGHLDGDGSISTYIDRYNTFKNPKYVYVRLWVRFVSASKDHILWLRNNIHRLKGLRGHLSKKGPYRKDQNVSIWELKFGKKESIQLLLWIYYNKNVPCLIRKRKIAERFINHLSSK